MRDIELAKLIAEEARVLRDNEIELAKLTQQEELARSKSEHEKDKEIEFARLHLEHEKLKMEQEIEHEKLKMEQEVELTRIDSQERQAKLDSDAKFAGQLELGKLGVEKAAHARNPKLPYFEESKDKMDSYLSRFEKYAVANKWDRSIWAAYLSALLKGRALEVYDRLSVADANDYEKLKDALLKNFDMTERGFRKKFRNDRPERSETFIQFGSRLRSYLDKWINMAKIENTFEAICDFMARDQFLESCSRELYVHLKPKTFKNLDEMAKEADLFAEARGGVHTCTNKGQGDNRGAAQNHSKPDVNKGGGKQEIKCGICGKGHLTIKCYKNPNRMQANSAEVGNEAKGGDSDAKNEIQEDKIQAIREATRPQTKRQMKSFLGLAGFYRRFIPSFSSIASPLTDLTKKDRPNSIKDWQDKHEKAFQTLKTRLTSSPILRLPVFRDEIPFVLRTDASDVGVGAVLLQEFEGEGRLPIAYASKKLLPREKNYSTIEKECLGIIWGIEKFRKYLYGVEFLLETDHKPLSYLQTAKVLNPRIMRWAMRLQPYRFRIVAIRGQDNLGADYLSR